MAQRKIYQITSSSASTFLDNSGRVVNGFVIWVTLLEWNESYPLNVKSLDPKLIDETVKDLITKRQGLDNLGNPG